jgi:hypothetical protein
MAPRNPRDIQREVVKDLGEHIRKNRRGLPLLTTGPLDGKKETKKQTQSREEFEEKLKVRSEDHVSIFLQPIVKPEKDEDKDASDSDDKEDIDAEEVEHIEAELMELLNEADDGDESDDSSVNCKDEETTNHELLESNNHSIRTEQVNFDLFFILYDTPDYIGVNARVDLVGSNDAADSQLPNVPT